MSHLVNWPVAQALSVVLGPVALLHGGARLPFHGLALRVPPHLLGGRLVLYGVFGQLGVKQVGLVWLEFLILAVFLASFGSVPFRSLALLILCSVSVVFVLVKPLLT